MSTTTLRATRIGAHAHRYLSATSRTGRVISEFRQGVNVLFDEVSEAAIVTIQTDHVPLHPWAIELPGAAPDLAPGVSCHTAAKSIRSKRDLIISFAGAAVHRLCIQPWNQEDVARVLHNKPFIDVKVKATIPSTESIQLETKIVTILLRERLPADAHTLGELVGRGRGSTPAGDDALLGMLAALMAQAAAYHQARLQLAALRDELQSVDLIKRTTHASAQMLQAGLAGSFPEPLCELATILKQANALDLGLQESIDHVLSLGATSGWFMLMGFMSAIQEAQDAAVRLG